AKARHRHYRDRNPGRTHQVATKGVECIVIAPDKYCFAVRQGASGNVNGAIVGRIVRNSPILILGWKVTRPSDKIARRERAVCVEKRIVVVVAAPLRASPPRHGAPQGLRAFLIAQRLKVLELACDGFPLLSLDGSSPLIVGERKSGKTGAADKCG